MFGFTDETVIEVASGHGGSGSVSFRREKYVPKGGPDGGDGGKGGDVVFQVKRNLRTLTHLRSGTSYHAEHGEQGHGRRKHGRDGHDKVIEVPPGTVIRDADTGDILMDLKEDHTRWVFLTGGKGGKGNWHFRTSTRQAPRYAQNGLPGETRRVRVELRIIADIGFVGFPNAGKSSLLNYLTNAHSKVAGYPFTTKIPHLGVFSYGERILTLADIPGIIEGASRGAGLGLAFLKHISRTSVIAYIIDLSDDTFLESYTKLKGELESYSRELVEKQEIIIASKLDLPGTEQRLEELRDSLKEKKVYGMSVFSGSGIREVQQAFLQMAGS